MPNNFINNCYLLNSTIICLSILIFCCGCSYNKDPKSIEYWKDYHNDLFKSPLIIIPNSGLLSNGEYKTLFRGSEKSLKLKEVEKSENPSKVLIFDHNEYTYDIHQNNIITFSISHEINARGGENWFKYIGLINGNRIYLNFKLIAGSQSFPPVIDENMILEFTPYEKMNSSFDFETDMQESSSPNSKVIPTKKSTNEKTEKDINKSKYTKESASAGKTSVEGQQSYRESLQDFMKSTDATSSNCSYDEFISADDLDSANDIDYANAFVDVYNYCEDMPSDWENVSPARKMIQKKSSVEKINNTLYIAHNYKFSDLFNDAEIDNIKEISPMVKDAAWSEIYRGNPYYIHPNHKIGLIYIYYDSEDKIINTISFNPNDFVRGYYLK